MTYRYLIFHFKKKKNNNNNKVMVMGQKGRGDAFTSRC